MSLLEQNTTRKGQVNENATELDASNNKGGKYKVEAICNSAIYAKKSELGHQLGLYYLGFWKNYLKEENTWELYLAVKHFKKLISLFYKNFLDKATTIFKALDTPSLMAKPIIKLAAKSAMKPAK